MQLAVMSTLDMVNLCLQMLLAILISQERSYLHLLKDPRQSGLLLGLQAKLSLACTVCVSESAASNLGNFASSVCDWQLADVLV